MKKNIFLRLLLASQWFPRYYWPMTQIPSSVAVRIEPPEPISGTLKIAQKPGILIAKNSSGTYNFVIKNYSKSGLGIFLKQGFPPNTFIEISINGISFPPLEAKTVWSGVAGGEAPAGFTNIVGLTFAPKDDEARDNQLRSCRELDRVVEEMVQKRSGKSIGTR